MPTHKSSPITLIAAITLLALACTCGPVAPLLTSTLTPPAPIPTSTPESPATSLQPDVPWLIVSTSDGLWAADKDGSNPVQLAPKSWLDINLQASISSTAHKIAYISSGTDYYHGLALNLISLPDGKIQKVTDLTTSSTEPGESDSPGTPKLEAMRAISEQIPSYAWSPDGKQLAFIGSLDGPKADVYVYDLSSGKIQKVSNDDGLDFLPNWTPDGKSILYFEADGFGTGAGLSMKGAWLAAADGSGATKLYTPSSSGENLLGWHDGDTAVLTSWDAAIGTSNLRLFNVRTQKQTVLSQGAVQGAAVATGIDQDRGAILFGSDQGLFLVAPGSTQPQKLTSDKVDAGGYPAAVRWQDYGRIFIVRFAGGSLSTFMADGSQRQDAPFNPSMGQLDVSSFGLIWGWTDKGGESEGAWISGPGLDTVQVSKEASAAPQWNVDNDLLFFVGSDLYRSTFNSHYSDTGKVSSLTGDVVESAWMGFGEALTKKYGP